MEIRKPYDAHERVTVSFPQGEGRTKLSMQDECDINKMMSRWQVGASRHVNPLPATYGDFTSALDYDASLIQLTEAQALFDELPSDIRKTMDNDPAVLVRFIADENNRAEAEKLGLVEPAKPKPPTPTPPEPEPNPPTPPE